MVLAEDSRPWIQHIRQSGRESTSLPVIWHKDPCETSTEVHPGSLVARIPDLRALIALYAKKTGDSVLSEMEISLFELVSVIMIHVRPDQAEQMILPRAGNPDTFSKDLRKLSKEVVISDGLSNDAPVSCDRCGKLQEPGKKLQRCGKCRVAWYCGIECQRAAWSGHKAHCFEASG
jgi:hypothetical protein